MRRLLAMLRERARGAAWLLSIVAAMLALLSLGLAAYAVYHILSSRQDVRLSYPPVDPGVAPVVPALAFVVVVVVAVVVVVVVAVPLLAAAGGFRRSKA